MRKLKIIWQKLTRGFSDEEMWELDVTMSKWLLPRIRHWNKTRHGYFNGLTEKQTDKVVANIIESLEFNASGGVYDYTKRGYLKKLEKHAKGLRLLGEYWTQFWD